MSDVRLDLFRRAIDHIRQGTTDLADDVFRIDAADFHDRDVFDREFAILFRQTPLVACLSQDLPECGSFRIFEDAGVPLIVVRGKDGQVRAFLNVCPHRGGRIVRESSGRSARFSCSFHGWTFDNQGKAIGIPEKENFCGAVEAETDLFCYPAEERHGLVFVQLTPGEPIDLDTHLGEFGEQLELLDFDRASRVLDHDFPVAANWKYVIDTYFENYHVPVLHRDTLASAFDHKLRLFDHWGPHHRLSFPHVSTRDWLGKPEMEWPVDALPIAYFLFPNVVITLGTIASEFGTTISLHRLFPHSAGEMVTRLTQYVPGGLKSPEHRAEIDRNFETIHYVMDAEDYRVARESWPNIVNLPSHTSFAIGRNEIAVQNFHMNVADRIGSAGAKAGVSLEK